MTSSFKTQKLDLSTKNTIDFLDKQPLAIVIIDTEGKLLFFSQEAESLFGHSKELVYGKSFETLLSKYQQSNNTQLLYHFLSLSRNYSTKKKLNLIARKANGFSFPITIYLGPISLSEELCTVGYIFDSEEETAKKKPSEMYSTAFRQQIADLDELAYTISHDLKGFFRRIHNYCDMLEENLDSSKKNSLFIERIRHLANQGSSQVHTVSKYAHIGQIIGTISQINMNELVRELIPFLTKHIPEESLHIDVEESLDSIKGDPIMLKELLSHLISNALKYNNSAVKIIKIFQESDYKKLNEPDIIHQSPAFAEDYIYAVSDNGIGISPEDLPNITKIFYRANESSEYSEGEGLGLAVVKKILAMQEGKLWIYSKKGKGTTVYFSL